MTPMFKDLIEGLIGLSIIIVLMMTGVYYNKVVRIHNWIIRRKDTGDIWRNPRGGFPMFSPSHEGSHGLQSCPSKKMQQHVCDVLGNPLRDLVPKIFTGD